jgi:hypothetical protein
MLMHPSDHRQSRFTRARRAFAGAALNIMAALTTPACAMQISVTETRSDPVVSMHGVIEVGDTAKLERQLASVKR